MLFKDFGKILHIHNSAVKSNGLHLQMGCVKEVHGMFDAFFLNILGQCFPSFFFSMISTMFIKRYLHCEKRKPPQMMRRLLKKDY